MANNKALSLESLYNTIQVIPFDAAGFYELCCLVCLDSQSHKSGVTLRAIYTEKWNYFTVSWNRSITEKDKISFADMVSTTEFAACALALLLVQELTNFKVIRQAVRGTTIDYYLGLTNANNDLLFNNVARLEVSGILKENKSNTVDGRLREKAKRLKPGLPAIIAVVEFSKPWSKMVDA
jgi:hypothetical protein